MLRGVYPEIAEGLSMDNSKLGKPDGLFFLCVLCVLCGELSESESFIYAILVPFVVQFLFRFGCGFCRAKFSVVNSDL